MSEQRDRRNQKDRRTTTPQLEELRSAQAKKQPSAIDPTHVLDRAIYQLWETINDLDQIQPERVEHYRVSIFGSSRIRRGDPIYEEVKKLSSELARLGIDIVTGGGPGLMEAANSGAREGQAGGKARSFGLAIHLPSEEAANPFVDKVFRHRTFFSRLHHFIRLSSAFIVMPGGIGTALELFMVWQLLQVKHMKQHPLILVGTMWPGLIEWMRATMVERGLVSPPDFDVIKVVGSSDEAIPIIRESYDRWLQQERAHANTGTGT
ncbi:MAG TPA: TIGR00730 family Rossman fold protein [Thermoanaerobaculia bacterium]|nr:TIGR00730 family Rossman fold protein [Thermoanaerobaculia bacterium]